MFCLTSEGLEILINCVNRQRKYLVTFASLTGRGDDMVAHKNNQYHHDSVHTGKRFILKNKSKNQHFKPCKRQQVQVQQVQGNIISEAPCD